MNFIFKANTNFFVYTSVFKDEYQKMSDEISKLIASRNNWQQDEKSYVETVDDQQFWVVSRKHPDLDFFRKVMIVVAHNHTDDMLKYLSQHSIIRYLSLEDDSNKVIIPQTRIPNVRGHDYMLWIDSLLANQQVCS
jgi:hypothetical protein